MGVTCPFRSTYDKLGSCTPLCALKVNGICAFTALAQKAFSDMKQDQKTFDKKEQKSE